MTADQDQIHLTIEQILGLSAEEIQALVQITSASSH